MAKVRLENFAVSVSLIYSDARCQCQSGTNVKIPPTSLYIRSFNRCALFVSFVLYASLSNTLPHSSLYIIKMRVHSKERVMQNENDNEKDERKENKERHIQGSKRSTV